MNHSAVRGWYAKLKQDVGAGTLYYGNVFEYGSWTVDPASGPLVGCDPMPPPGSGNQSAYCEANTILRTMADAIVRTTPGGAMLEETGGHASPCNPHPKPGHTVDECNARIAPGMLILDPSVPSAQVRDNGMTTLTVLAPAPCARSTGDRAASDYC